MKRYVAISQSGHVDIHLPHPTGNYATLCGMDGDDPDPMVDQVAVAVPRGAKVTCRECREIWQLARSYSHLEFTK
jgi:hypothetical protein